MCDKETLSLEKYNEQFETKNIKEKALERAWKNRNFEIDLFWKRAMYFWAFITLTYAGFSQANGWMQIVIAFIGSLLSWVWYLAHKGSKKWQENWEKHIDLLEDTIEGPIYKTVLREESFSVSKLSLVVALINMFSWCLLSSVYLVNILWVSKTPSLSLEVPTLCAKVSCLIAYYLILAFFLVFIWKFSKTSKKNSICFEKRKINYDKAL